MHLSSIPMNIQMNHELFTVDIIPQQIPLISQETENIFQNLMPNFPPPTNLSSLKNRAIELQKVITTALMNRQQICPKVGAVIYTAIILGSVAGVFFSIKELGNKELSNNDGIRLLLILSLMASMAIIPLIFCCYIRKGCETRELPKSWWEWPNLPNTAPCCLKTISSVLPIIAESKLNKHLNEHIQAEQAELENLMAQAIEYYCVHGDELREVIEKNLSQILPSPLPSIQQVERHLHCALKELERSKDYFLNLDFTQKLEEIV